jgi:hypothetical protein
MTGITDEQIRRLAAKIQARDKVTPEVAHQRAATWAADQMLKKAQPKPTATAFDPVTRTYPGPHYPSVVCECAGCVSWRGRGKARASKAARAYNGSAGGW